MGNIKGKKRRSGNVYITNQIYIFPLGEMVGWFTHVW